MAITTYYRGVAFIKDYFVLYFNSVFKAAQKGSIVFTNGFKEIVFSKEPAVVKRVTNDLRPALPFVLVGPVRAEYIYRSVAKDFLKDAEPAALEQYRIYGGDIRLTMELDVRASQQEERDNLVDIVCLFLANPDAKDFFLRNNIVVEKPPSVSGEKEIYEPGIDHPIYAASVSVSLIGCWQIKTSMSYRFEELFLDVEFTLGDPSSGSGS
jgi:hypothetical protein